MRYRLVIFVVAAGTGLGYAAFRMARHSALPAEVARVDVPPLPPPAVAPAFVMPDLTGLDPSARSDAPPATDQRPPTSQPVRSTVSLALAAGTGVTPPAKTAVPPTAKPGVPPLPARVALSFVGTDPVAEAVWAGTINDPTVPAETRKDLIEDLNEDGFPDPHHVTPDDLGLILSRMELIEALAPGAMDDTNAAAFAEAYKDLSNMVARIAGG